jgi:RNA polymerase sigma-70 factor, ECF subfamily
MENYSSIEIDELAQRCSISGDIGAWEEFVRRLHRHIAKVVLRASVRFGDPSKETVDDLIQETYLKLCADNYRILREFKPSHPGAFPSYVQVLAVNVVRDHFKSSYSEKRGANKVEGMKDDFIAAAGEDSAGSPRRIERAVLIEEIQRQLDLCVDGANRDRNARIFWLHYRVGLSASAIAALPEIGLNIKGVESLILRITRELRARVTTPMTGLRGKSESLAEGTSRAGSF